MICEDFNIKERVKTYVLQASYADKDIITDDSHIFKEGFFDSIGLILLISFIEEEFNITTDQNELKEENFMSINAITGFICRKIESHSSVEKFE